MTWFKVDDSFYDHPKVFDAPDCALALWIRAGCWSARNLTDGFVPANLPARLCDDPDTAVAALVDRGLWRRTKGGHQFHDWAAYQPTGDEVRDLRAKRAEAGRRGGQAKAAKQTASKPVASARGVGKQNAAPTRPDPSRRDGGSVGESPTGPRRASADEERIDQTTARMLHDMTGKPVSLEWAARVRQGILAGRSVDDPGRYVAAAVRKNPGNYLPAADEHPSSRSVAQAIAESLGKPL